MMQSEIPQEEQPFNPKSLNEIADRYDNPEMARAMIATVIQEIRSLTRTENERNAAADFLRKFTEDEKRMQAKRARSRTASSINLLQTHIDELIERFQEHLKEMRQDDEDWDGGVQDSLEAARGTSSKNVRGIMELMHLKPQDFPEPTEEELAQAAAEMEEDLANLEKLSLEELQREFLGPSD